MKKIVTAVLLSFLGPGLGQIYNRDRKKGVLLLIVSTALFFLPSVWLIRKVAPHLPDPNAQPITPEMVQTIALEVIGKDRHVLNVVSLVFLGVWAYAITQAYFRAKEIVEAESSRSEDGPGE